MRRFVFLGALLLGTSAHLFLVPRSQGANETRADLTRDFTVSADPEVAVLTVTYSGGLSGKRTVYRLAGDGHLRRELRDRSGTLAESSEVELDFEEVRDLVGVAVNHGLLDISQKELLAEVTKPLPIEDAATMGVEVLVASYTLDGEELGPVQRKLQLTSPWALRRFFPESQPIKGMAELSGRLATYFKRQLPGDHG